MTTKERFVEYLKFKGFGQTAFEESAGLSRGAIAKKTGFNADSIEKIAMVCPDLNINWLITGLGEMLNVHQEEVSIDTVIVGSEKKIIDTEEDYQQAIEEGLRLLPEVDFKFAAGQVTLLNGTQDITRYWYLPDCKDCEGVAQVVGNSMSPALPSGCWVALKKYTLPSNNPNKIPFGNIFGVVVEDDDTGEYHGHIKVLRRYKEPDLARKYWIAQSINNREFDDFDIEIAKVKSLWIVKQHIVSDILL